MTEHSTQNSDVTDEYCNILKNLQINFAVSDAVNVGKDNTGE